MNIRDLKYLVALRDHLHFGKAAEACFVSQPTLSMQVKKLEEQLGVKLLERTNKSVSLTSVGMIISERARDILLQTDGIRDIAKALSDPYHGEITMGIIPTLAPYFLPYFMPRFIKKFPRAKLYLLEEKTDLLIEKLKQGKLDTIIIATDITSNNLHSAALFDEEFLLALPSDHALAKRKAIKLTELPSKNLLLLEEGHCLRDQALEICSHEKISDMKDFHATSLETIRYMVAEGLGATLIPKLACKNCKGVTYIPFTQPKPLRKIRMVWRASSCRSLLLNEIAQFIQQKPSP